MRALAARRRENPPGTRDPPRRAANLPKSPTRLRRRRAPRPAMPPKRAFWRRGGSGERGAAETRDWAPTDKAPNGERDVSAEFDWVAAARIHCFAVPAHRRIRASPAPVRPESPSPSVSLAPRPGFGTGRTYRGKSARVLVGIRLTSCI